MNPLPLSEFARIVHGEPVGVEPDASIRGFALDSREVMPGFLFVAIKGSRADGHEFAKAAIGAGAVAVLAERTVYAPHILVPNVVQALADYASFVRAGFHGPVVGITGSAGKTTTKEFVAAALSPLKDIAKESSQKADRLSTTPPSSVREVGELANREGGGDSSEPARRATNSLGLASLGSVLKTEGNRNSEFSSPLLWAELTGDHNAVVVEMGMRGFGQVQHLASFTKPTIGVVTNIGHSHMELVGNQEGVAKAKAELLEALPPDGRAVLWAEDPFLAMLSEASAAPVSTFGFSEGADCRLTDYKVLNWRSCEIAGICNGQGFKAVLPAVGRHIALNAACALLVASLCGVDVSDAAEAVGKASLPPMRMEIVDHAGVTILLDAYNASPASVGAALETLCEMPVAGRRIAVLGDMRELGNYAEEGHRKIGRLAARLGLDELVLIGESARWIGETAVANGFPEAQLKHADALDEITELIKALQPGDVVLIKGSRVLELERALDFLKESTE